MEPIRSASSSANSMPVVRKNDAITQEPKPKQESDIEEEELNPNRLADRRREKQILNRQLRKAMVPKNALSVLNEVKGLKMSEFTFERDGNGLFAAYVTINSLDYVGRGRSKNLAKHAACEDAWRDYIIACRTPKKEDEAAPLDSDDLPMVNLACYAIFKLFGQWKNEGFKIPAMNAALSEEANPGRPIRLELPPNSEEMHPASLLTMMRPGTCYEECGTSGREPNIIHYLRSVVDKITFTACGRSKKIARSNVAVAACNVLFDTNFEADQYESVDCYIDLASST